MNYDAQLSCEENIYELQHNPQIYILPKLQNYENYVPKRMITLGPEFDFIGLSRLSMKVVG
jgi:hypothetical protein